MPWQRSLLVLQCAHFNESFDTRTSASTALSQVVATSLASGVLVPKRGRLFVELIRTALFVASQKSHHVVQWTDVYVTIRECFEVLGSSSALVDEMSWVEQVGLDQAVRAPLQPRAVKAETDQRWDSLRASFDADKVDWSFWAYWYDGCLSGRQVPSQLALEIIKSEDINWDDPIAANAKIVEIWKRHQANAAPQLPPPDDLQPPRRKALRDQVAFLLKTSDATSLSARALSEQIRIAIEDWCNAQRCNQLPEDLAIYAQMQATLAGIAGELDSARSEQDKFAALEVRVLELEAENSALLAKLKSAAKSPERHPFVLEFHKTSGKLAAGALYGGASLVAVNFIGVENVQALASTARAYLAEFVKPN